jgi:hypothetical protein
MNADGTGERRVASGAYHPTWAPDGSGLLFVQDNRIMRVDLEGGTIQTLHHGKAPPTRATLEEPEMFAPDLFAVVLRGSSNAGAGVLDLAAGTYLPVSTGRQACQITWVPGRKEVVWIESGGRGDKQVMHAAVGSGDVRARVLIDLPGAYSHEYFPRVTPDGRWLIWGAAAEGHEHDRADYEIFAWRIGTPWDTALRLTYSAANDQWPDLYIAR